MRKAIDSQRPLALPSINNNKNQPKTQIERGQNTSHALFLLFLFSVGTMLWQTFFYSLLLLSLLFRCTGDESLPEVTDSEEAPMDKREREALYSAIQGFVGDSWNGSALYPDPCGWTPIQVFITNLSFLKTFF